MCKREEAEAAEEKARSNLDKVKALLEEARALVTVYVVRQKNEERTERLGRRLISYSEYIIGAVGLLPLVKKEYCLRSSAVS